MFGFLKDKLKGVMKSFSKKVEEEAPEEKIEVTKEEKPSKKEVPKKEAPKKKEVKKEEKKEVKKEEKKEIKKEAPKVQEPKVEEKIIEPVVEKAVEELKVEEQVEPKVEAKVDEIAEEVVEEKVEKKGFFSKLFKKEEKVEEKVEVKKEEPEEKKGFFGKITEVITTKKISADKFDELFWDLELALLENNVALEVIEKIKSDLKSELVDKPIPRGKVDEVIASSLHDSIEGLFNVGTFNILDKIKEKKPYVICFIGINGSGKTTSIAKVANYLQSQGLSVVMAAADTFRAAAIDQLQLHADKLGIKLIRHDYGSDPAAVAFDAVKHAEAKKVDVVLVDTAGRLHSNINLMDEMKKIIRVAKPDLKIFFG
jgi:fused signal recognition particle receptor